MIATKPTATGSFVESIGMPEYQLTPRPAYGVPVSNPSITPTRVTSDADVISDFTEVSPIDGDVQF